MEVNFKPYPLEDSIGGRIFYLEARLLGKGQVVALGVDVSWESVRRFGAI